MKRVLVINIQKNLYYHVYDLSKNLDKSICIAAYQFY